MEGKRARGGGGGCVRQEGYVEGYMEGERGRGTWRMCR